MKENKKVTFAIDVVKVVRPIKSDDVSWTCKGLIYIIVYLSSGAQQTCIQGTRK